MEMLSSCYGRVAEFNEDKLKLLLLYALVV